VEQHQFADARTVDRVDAAEIEDHFPSIFQNFPHEVGERDGFIAINDAPLTMNDEHVATISSFQTKLQLRLLMV